MKKNIPENDESYGFQLPSWYWKNSLHDALILSVRKTVLPFGQKFVSECNCLEIDLDASGALYDTGVKTIRLYCCKCQTDGVEFDELSGCWWVKDQLELLPDNRYVLSILLGNKKCRQFPLRFVFRSAEVERV